MTDHYYSKNPQAETNPQTWQAELLGKTYVFHTDDGVFSKHKIDFGSKLLVESYTEPSVQGDLLDLGCGYGPIGMSLADAFPNREILMVDVNQRAVHLAKRNISENAIANAQAFSSEGFNNLENHTFASIITNPPIRAGKKVMYQLFEQSQAALEKEGTLWIVIQKKHGAPSARKKLEEIFPSVQIVTRKKGYYIISACNT